MQQQNAAYSFHPQPLTKSYFRAVAKKRRRKSSGTHKKKGRHVTSLFFIDEDHYFQPL